MLSPVPNLVSVRREPDCGAFILAELNAYI